MALSDDPDVRARQVANLVPGAGAAEPGNTRRATHGLRSPNPWRLLDDEVVEGLRDWILEAIPDHRRDTNGSVTAGDRLQAEVLAVMGMQVIRAGAYFARNGDDPRAHDLWNRTALRFSSRLDAALEIGGRRSHPAGARGSLAQLLAALDEDGEVSADG